MDLIEAIEYSENMKTMNLLRKVDRTGTIGRKNGEAFRCMGWIQFCPPRPEIDNDYNCYRLTEKGREELKRVSDFIGR
jgi:hypothetical protein